MNTHSRLWSVIRVLLVASMMLVGQKTNPARAAGPWYVTTSGSDSNSCLSPASPCAAINGAIGKASSGDTIYVATGTYTGSGNEVVLIDRNITLSGGWDAAFTTQTGMSTIDGGGVRRGIFINALNTSIERFAIQNGYSANYAGGIFNCCSTTLTLSIVSGNTASTYGGGIYNNSTYGILNLNASIVTGNTTGIFSNINYPYSGGGIFNADGAVIYLNNSIVSANTSYNDGGGLSNNSIMTLNNSTVSGNTSRRNGGGIKNTNTLNLYNTTINGNTSIDSGGGIFNFGTLITNNSTVSDNTATSGGGIFSVYSAILNNTTVSGNLAPSGQGGGIYHSNHNNGTMTLNNSTVSHNTGQVGGGIYGSISIKNSVLESNTSTGSGPDCHGSINSAGYNLIRNTADCTITGDTTGNLTGVAGLLGPLQDNSGPTPTQALLPGSPATNAGNPAGCTDNQGNPLVTDQRGKPRFGRCDIGAYELQPLGFSNKLADRNISHPGEAITYTITLDNPGVAEITGVQLTDALPNHLGYVDGSLTASKGQASYQSGVISWNGTLNAQEQVDVAFAATVDGSAPLNQPITNTAEILGGGETFLRSAAVQIEPYRIYTPFISKPCLPIYIDDFSNPASGWPVADDGNNRYEYLNGEYRMLVRPDFWAAGAYPGFQASDYSVSVNLRNTSGADSSYGIAFGVAGDWSTLYTLEIFPDGWYGIYRYDPGGIVTLAEAFSPTINQGTATNLIRVERNGEAINAYANGQLLASMNDGTYTGSRYVGLVVFSYDQPNVDIRFDNFIVHETTCQGTNFASRDTRAGALLPSQRFLNTHNIERGNSKHQR